MYALVLTLFPLIRFVVVGTILAVNVVPPCLLEGQHQIASWKKMHSFLSYLIYHCSLPVLLSFLLNVFAFFSSHLLCLLLFIITFCPFIPYSSLTYYTVFKPFFPHLSPLYSTVSSPSLPAPILTLVASLAL